MIVRGMNLGKMIYQEKYENMEKQKEKKKILWNMVQAKEEEPSETSKRELVGGEESQQRQAQNPGDKRDKKEG